MYEKKIIDQIFGTLKDFSNICLVSGFACVLSSVLINPTHEFGQRVVAVAFFVGLTLGLVAVIISVILSYRPKPISVEEQG